MLPGGTGLWVYEIEHGSATNNTGHAHCFQFCKQWLLALLNIEKISVKSLLFVVIKSYKKLCKRIIKRLLYSVLAKYRDLSLARHRQIINFLATDKSRYFARPRLIIDNYCLFSFIPADKWKQCALDHTSKNLRKS